LTLEQIKYYSILWSQVKIMTVNINNRTNSHASLMQNINHNDFRMTSTVLYTLNYLQVNVTVTELCRYSMSRSQRIKYKDWCPIDDLNI